VPDLPSLKTLLTSVRATPITMPVRVVVPVSIEALSSPHVPLFSYSHPLLLQQAIVPYRSPIYFLSPPTGWAAFLSLVDIAGQFFVLTIL
jgi:hypothetical protein